MSQGVVTNQHYVPQSYLKRFATGEEQIYVFDKGQTKQFKTKIKKVATERYFYDLPADEADKDADSQELEKLFQMVEDHFIVAVDEVVSLVKAGRNMKPEQKAAMAYFLHVQQTRTRKIRNRQKEMLDKMLMNLIETQLKLKNYDLADFDIAAEWDEKAVMSAQADMMFNYQEVEHFLERLLDHTWFVGINETGCALWTSDNPVVVRAHQHHPIMSMAGIASEGVEVAFPLTPKLILILFEKTFHNDLANRPYEHITLNQEDVVYYNEMQVEQSHRQVYSSSEDFTIAQSLCEQHPELRDPERPHTQVSELKIDGMDIVQAKNVSAVLKRVRRFQDIGRRWM